MDSTELIDMIANDAPANEVSDAIKAIAYAKSADMVDKTKATAKFKRSWNRGIEMLGKFGHTMEVAMRMTEVDMLVATGKFTPKQAAHESLRRLNYGRRGGLMDYVNSVVPLFTSTETVASVTDIPAPAASCDATTFKTEVCIF